MTAPFRTSIPLGDAGTFDTLKMMAKIADFYAATPIVRDLATSIVRDLNPRDYTGHAEAIRQWAADHIVFLRDPRGTELLHTPRWILREIARHGVARVDCDDAATMTAALGKSIGLKARFVVVGFQNKRAPFAHVWTELASPIGVPEWIEQDVTRTAQRLPWSMVSRLEWRGV